MLPQHGLRVALAFAVLTLVAPPAHGQTAWPTGVEFYLCGRHETTPAGELFVRVAVNRNGSSGWNAQWSLTPAGELAPDLNAWWHGDPAASGFSVSQALPRLPPLGSRMSVTLNNGERIEGEFLSPTMWERSRRSGSHPVTGWIYTRSEAFIAALDRAQWAEIDVIAVRGVTLAHTRIDLSALGAALLRLRALTADARADAAGDYAHLCWGAHNPD